MHWLEASEIAFGLLVEGKIPESKVLPEKFYPPYDEGVRAYKSGQNTREDLTQLIGVNSMQVSYSAVESMNGLGKVNDWIHILEQSAARYQAGERFENYAKKLKRGNEVDWGKITEISKKAQNAEDIDFYTPLSQVEPEGVPFISTGWPPLDEHMGGLPKTGLVIIGGRPKTGKTYLKTKLSACYVKEHSNKVVANHTLEMLKGQISQRYADTEELTQEQKDRILLRDLPDSPEKVINIASTIENLGMIIIDFADLMISGETTESAMSHIYRTLMLGAKELQCTIILLAQLSGDKGGIPRPNQIRWCLPGNTKIPLASGEYLTAKEIYENDSNVELWAYDKGSLVPAHAKIWKTRTTQPIYKIITMSGYEIECSDNHPILTGKGWVAAKELSKKTPIAVVKQYPKFFHTINYCHHKARLLGLMLGDGYMPLRKSQGGRGGGISWTEPNETIIAEAEYSLNIAFPELRMHKYPNQNMFTISFPQKEKKNSLVGPFGLWLEELGVRGVYSKDRFIPEQCFSWDRKSTKELLKGLFSSDGSVDKYGNVRFGSYSHQLLKDVKRLLIKFGIISRISGFELSINNLENTAKFCILVGFLGSKQNKLEKVIRNKKTSKNKSSARSELLPIEATKLIRQHGSKKLSKNRRVGKCRALKLVSNKEKIRHFANNSIWWDEIRLIELVRYEETYDINVPGYHNFVADDIITHNTRLAEAFAYMVLMTYNPNTDYHAEKDEHILPIRPNMAYLCCWLSRGGSKTHKTDFPGAIQIAFRGDKGWGSKTKSTSWYPLNEN